MNIWLVNPFDPLPLKDPLRYSYLLRVLAEAGHSVTWWTSRFAHWGKCYISKCQLEVENSRLRPHGRIVATWTTPYWKHVGVARVINHLAWARTFYRTARRSSDRPDVIFVSSTPLYAAHLALRLAKEYGALAVLDVVDLWPEAFENVVPSPLRPYAKWCFRPLLALENRNFRKVNAITAVSETYRLTALSRSGSDKPSMTVPYGIDFSECASYKPACVSPPDSRIRVCYAGTLGPGHDVSTVLNAARLLSFDRRLEFIIAGDGPMRAELESKANAMGLLNVKFTGWLDLGALRKLLTTCLIGVIAVKKESVISVPLKAYEYWAAGMALVHSLSGDFEKLVKDGKLGVPYDAEDPISLANAISGLLKNTELVLTMGKSGRQLVEEKFDRQVIHRRLMSFLCSLSEKRRLEMLRD